MSNSKSYFAKNIENIADATAVFFWAQLKQAFPESESFKYGEFFEPFKRMVSSFLLDQIEQTTIVFDVHMRKISDIVLRVQAFSDKEAGDIASNTFISDDVLYTPDTNVIDYDEGYWEIEGMEEVDDQRNQMSR